MVSLVCKFIKTTTGTSPLLDMFHASVLAQKHVPFNTSLLTWVRFSISTCAQNNLNYFYRIP